MFDEKGNDDEYQGIVLSEEMTAIAHLSRCRVFPPTALFDRRRARDLRYPTGVVCGEDMVFVSLVRNRGPIVVLPGLLYGYRRRSGQITKWYTFVDGFEQKMDWLRTNWKAHWPDKTLSEIETVMWLGLVEVMTDFYWSRNRKKFLRLQAYLRANWPGKVPSAVRVGLALVSRRALEGEGMAISCPAPALCQAIFRTRAPILRGNDGGPPIFGPGRGVASTAEGGGYYLNVARKFQRNAGAINKQ